MAEGSLLGAVYQTVRTIRRQRRRRLAAREVASSALVVSCPTCGAKPGEWCNGDRWLAHMERHEAAGTLAKLEEWLYAGGDTSI